MSGRTQLQILIDVHPPVTNNVKVITPFTRIVQIVLSSFHGKVPNDARTRIVSLSTNSNNNNNNNNNNDN